MLLVQHRVELVDPGPEVGHIPPEGDPQHVQKFVHPVHQPLRRASLALDSGLPFVYYHLVGQVSSHDEVVFYNEGRFLIVENEPLEHPCADDSLLAIQIGGGFVNEIGHGSLGKGQDDGHSLQLSP